MSLHKTQHWTPAHYLYQFGEQKFFISLTYPDFTDSPDVMMLLNDCESLHNAVWVTFQHYLFLYP